MLLMPPVPAVSLSKSARAWRFVSLNLGGCGLPGGVGAPLAASVVTIADVVGASAAADFAAGAAGSSTGAAPLVAAAGVAAALGGVWAGLDASVDAGAFPVDAGDDEERPA